MESYLKGRGFNDNTEVLDTSFTPYGKSDQDNSSDSVSPEATPENLSSEVIFDEKDCPKVEVKSLDGKPSEIIIHLTDGRILCVECQYSDQS